MPGAVHRPLKLDDSGSSKPGQNSPNHDFGEGATHVDDDVLSVISKRASLFVTKLIIICCCHCASIAEKFIILSALSPFDTPDNVLRSDRHRTAGLVRDACLTGRRRIMPSTPKLHRETGPGGG